MKGFLKTILALLLLFASCKSGLEQQKDMFQVLPVEYKRKVKLSELIHPEFSYLPLQTDDSPLIGSVYKLQHADNAIFLLDYFSSKQLYKFNTKGKFITAIGTLGEGQGEYTSPSEFNVHQETIEIFDFSQRKLMKFNSSGKFISEKKLPYSIYEIAILDDDLRLLYVPDDSPDMELDSVLYALSNDYTDIEASFFPYEGLFDDTPFTGFFSKHGDEVTYARTIPAEFYTINKDLQLRPRFKLDFGKYSWPMSLEELQDREDEAEEIFHRGGIMSFVNRVLETDDFIVFQTLMMDEPRPVTSSIQRDEFVMCIYDKSKAKVWAFKEIENDIDGGTFSFPIATINNQFISVLSSEHILDEYIESADYKDVRHQSFSELKDSLNVDSNPVLMYFQFKKDYFKE